MLVLRVLLDTCLEPGNTLLHEAYAVVHGHLGQRIRDQGLSNPLNVLLHLSETAAHSFLHVLELDVCGLLDPRVHIDDKYVPRCLELLLNRILEPEEV